MMSHMLIWLLCLHKTGDYKRYKPVCTEVCWQIESHAELIIVTDVPKRLVFQSDIKLDFIQIWLAIFQIQHQLFGYEQD